jgi:hypothetical protein
MGPNPHPARLNLKHQQRRLDANPIRRRPSTGKATDLGRQQSIGPVPRWSNKLTPPRAGRDQVEVELVQESRSDALLHDAGGAHADVLVPGDRSGLLQGAFESVGDDGER